MNSLSASRVSTSRVSKTPTRSAAGILFASLMVCGLGLPSCDEKKEEEPPPSWPTAPMSNVLLITIDTLRADRLALYGGKSPLQSLQPMMPHSWVFENAYTDYPLTLPSHATILSGLHSFEHRVRDNSTFRLPDEVPTLAESLQERGYRTGAFVSAFVLDSRFGLDQGFDHYDDEMTTRASVTHPAERVAGATLERTRGWLQGQTEGVPFFAWVHLYDPHAPYAAPGSNEGVVASGYEGEIAYVDRQIGELFAWMKERGLDQNTLTVITADHGESFGDHGEETHGFLVYDGVMRVPLIWSHPSITQPERISHTVGLNELTPGILAFLEIPIPENTDGRPHLLHRVGEEAEPGFAFFENHATWYSYGLSPLEGLVAGRWKVIDSPDPELYDLKEDPAETKDLADEQQDRLRDMLDRLKNYKAVGRIVSQGARSPMSAEERQYLASLGYTSASSTVQEVEVGTGKNPRDHVRLLTGLDEVDRLLAQNRVREAADAARVLVQDYPKVERGLSQFAICLFMLGEHDEACDVARRILITSPDRTDVRLNLGKVLVQTKKFEEGAAELRRVLDDGETRGEAFIFLAQALVAQNQLEDALAVIDEALDKGTLERRERQWFERQRVQIAKRVSSGS